MSTEENANKDKVERAEPILPENKVEKIMEQMQILSLKKGRENGFDMSKFNEGQVDKLLNILEKNEDNAFKYHTKRLDSAQSITEKRIGASIVDQKTFRYALITGLALVACITFAILGFKSEFFIPWLTFLTGLAGGFGLSKLNTKKSPSKTNNEETLEESDDN